MLMIQKENNARLEEPSTVNPILEKQLESKRAFLRNYFSSRVRTQEDAEDLTQEVFLRAYRSIDSFRGECPFDYWLMKIATNLLKNYYRRLQTVPPTVSSESESDEDSSDWVQELGTDEGQYLEVEEKLVVERWVELSRAVCAPTEFSILWAYFRLESMEAVAKMMTMPEKTAWSHFRRGRSKLIAHIIEHTPALIGGATAVETALQKAIKDGKKLNAQELNALRHTYRPQKLFREACLKIAPYLETV